VPQGTDVVSHVAYGSSVTEPVRSSPPSLLLWPGVPYPGLASSLVLKDVPRMWGVMRHKVPCDTDTPYRA
jgi:hypothetical protein